MLRYRRVFLAITLLILCAAAGFFGFGPAIVEAGMNKVVASPLPTITEQTRQLHASLKIADMHADTLLWRRSLLDKGTRGQLDMPRLIEGNVALQIFSSVNKTPKHQNYDGNSGDTDNITLLSVAQLQPVKTWDSVLERSLWHAQKMARAAQESHGQLRVIRTPAELDKLLLDRGDGTRAGPTASRTPVGGMLSIEGLQDMDARLDNLDILYGAGFRMAGLAHFFDNQVAGSMHGINRGGLTPLGVKVVRKMEKLGMIVDIAHSSHRTVSDVLRMARRPVVSSHGGVQATCKANRNLSDEEIRGVAKTGGVIGIGYWDAAICSTAPAEIARAIQHVRDLVGIDHVGLGSDFDGAVATGFDTSQLVVVTQALVDRGFSQEEIRKVMGGNVLRVIRAGIVPQ
jgi:membrane dipeptidase